MVKIKEAIVVEGRYDKNTLSQILDASILETSGFGIFKDKQQMALLRRIAETRGLIVFTDSDGAGFVIRNHIKSAIPGKYLKHAYIPDIYGKEKRKAAPGKEGKLGVEGMTKEVMWPFMWSAVLQLCLCAEFGLETTGCLHGFPGCKIRHRRTEALQFGSRTSIVRQYSGCG